MGMYSNLQESDVVLFGEDKLRIDELDANSTFFERAVAAPSDEVLHVMWSLEIAMLVFPTIFIAILFVSIALSVKARSSPFNVYILFLSFPDWLYSVLCLMTCVMCVIKNDYYSMIMCRAQSAYNTFNITANCWLNAVISYEVHRLLKATKFCRKYSPPTMNSVVKRSLACYGFALFLALLASVQAPGWPIRNGPNWGFVCVILQETWQDMLFFYLFFIPMQTGIPFGYVFYVAYDVLYKSKLLPKQGKVRHCII